MDPNLRIITGQSKLAWSSPQVKDLLNERELAIEEGQAKFVEWEAAKRSIAERVP